MPVLLQDGMPLPPAKLLKGLLALQQTLPSTGRQAGWSQVVSL